MDDARFCTECNRPMAGFNTLVWCNYCEDDGVYAISSTTWGEASKTLINLTFGKLGPATYTSLKRLNSIFPNKEVEFKILASKGGMYTMGCRKRSGVELPVSMIIHLYYVEEVNHDGEIFVLKDGYIGNYPTEKSQYFS